MHKNIQSVIFNKKYFDKKKAISALINKGFKYNKIDETENYFRFRQFDPSKNKKYFIVKSTTGIKYVIEY